MKVVISPVNFIRSFGLIIVICILLFSEMYAEYGGMLHHAEVRCLSRGAMLKLLSLRVETEIFINEKGKVVDELDEKWLWHCYVMSAII
jgi:hypothetical protein